MEARTNRVEVGWVISEAFSLYAANAGVLLGSAVAVFVTLYTGFVVKLVEDVRDGRRAALFFDLGGGAGTPAAPAAQPPLASTPPPPAA